MRQICNNKNKIRWWKTERPHAVAHLMAYSFSSFQCQRPDWKALFFLSPLTSHLLPPTLSSRHRLLASSAISLFIFKEITGGSAELTFSPLFFFFHSLFYCFLSILSHSCFPSAPAFLSSIWSVLCYIYIFFFIFCFCVSSPSRFGFTKTLSHFPHYLVPFNLSIFLLQLFPYLRISPCRFSFPSNRSASSFMEAATSSLSREEEEKNEGEELWAIFTHYRTSAQRNATVLPWGKMSL